MRPPSLCYHKGKHKDAKLQIRIFHFNISSAAFSGPGAPRQEGRYREPPPYRSDAEGLKGNRGKFFHNSGKR